MDRRSWPWKKKSSEKAADKAGEKAAEKTAEKTVLAQDTSSVTLTSAGSRESQVGLLNRLYMDIYIKYLVTSRINF